MPSPTRVLFVAADLAPFTEVSEIAPLARTLPERLQETGTYELRIMMPRYGVISERKNRLHEVIRLSGAEIVAGEAKETLKVKVASIPGLRLQVYFMENVRHFKRKGAYEGREGEQYDDNAERALFFGRAALATIRNLGWTPDLVHALGWAGAFVPYLVRHDFAADPHLGKAKVLYTPDAYDPLVPVGDVLGGVDAGLTLRAFAEAHADGLFVPETPVADAAGLAAEAMVRYDEALGEVAA